ncbi:MAG: ATPase [Rhodospirillales bacterium]|nr:ATPase [Rhodospirillales bacterium]
MNDSGKVLGDGIIRFERILPGPIERVWSYLADADMRAKWLAGGTMTTTPGQSFEMVFRHADLSPVREERPAEIPKDEFRGTHKLLRYEPPRILTMTWDESPNPSEVTFELTEQGPDVRLVLTHRKLATKADMINTAGGWHTHLGTLYDQLHDRTPRAFWSEWKRVHGQYDKMFAESKGLTGT